MPLYAGVCETNITPPIGVWMCGYAFRPTGCVGIHDELYARAAVFSNGRGTVAILSTDLIGLDFDLVARVRKGIREATGIPDSAIMLNSTHTHGGPNVRTFNAMGERDEAYVDVLARKLVGVAKQAAERMRPARLSVRSADAQIGVNRRQTGGPGGTFIGRNLAGPVDTTVQTLAVKDSRGQPFAVLFTHACHGTTLGGDNLLITADWAGYACEHVRRECTGAIGHTVVPMFLQGCCGNINPLDRGTFEAAERNGRTVGEAAMQALWDGEEADAGLAAGDGISFAERTVDLPLVATPVREQCEGAVKEWQEKLDDARRGGNVGAILNAEGMLQYATDELRRAHEGHPATQPFAIQCLTVGDLAILGMPGEVFVQYGLDFAAARGSTAFVLGYTNGVHGYVPTAADFPLGGYEVGIANRYYGAPMIGPECEGIIRDTAYELLGVESRNRQPYEP